MEVQFKDKILLCVDCGEEFVFTISAQEYFASQGFTEDPKRCKTCYLQLKRAKKREGDGRKPYRQYRDGKSRNSVSVNHWRNRSIDRGRDTYNN